ncbi:MAG: sulfotransferase, partial [Akkermansiaceae bacterium]|nr:sulfotransferase [Akkermansiaceae bacterium]
TEEEGKRIPCTQTPRNVYYLREILGAYPDARVIWMVRDPRAVLCSQ